MTMPAGWCPDPEGLRRQRYWDGEWTGHYVPNMPTLPVDAYIGQSFTAPAGWYPDPQGLPRQQYWDGRGWTQHFVANPQVHAYVEGPNHALHAILTLFTWPFCGGWGWVWLIVALSNRKRVRYF